MTERIILDVDQVSLDEAIAKLRQAITLSQTSFGTKDMKKATRELSNFAAFWALANAEISATESELNLRVSDLPGINREMRIILGQIPGLREAMRVYFNVKRLARGVEVGDIGLVLSVVATAILLIRALEQRQRNIDRRQREQEAFIRRERGLTHDQYVGLMEDWQSYFRSRPG